MSWKPEPGAHAGGDGFLFVKVFNALDACEKLKLTADEMDTKWGVCKKVPPYSLGGLF
jgi:hypothetical protein